ncbi:MAG: nucleotidyltransferase domain-containing protein [Chloroflexota bacterium]
MIPPRFQAAIDQVLPELQNRSDVLAIFLSGSFLHGREGPTSDVDLYVAVSSAFRQRRQVVTPNGTLAEIFLNPVDWCRRSFALGDFHAMHMVGHGQIVWSRDPALATSLQAEARAAYERGPFPLTGLEWEAKRYGLLDSYEDAVDVVAQRPHDAFPALWRVIQHAVALRYARARRWPPKDKWLLPDLGDWAPDLAAALRAFALENDPKRTLVLVERALRLALGPDDDLRIRSWESEPSLPPAHERR